MNRFANCTPEEAVKLWRQLAQQLHPDKHPAEEAERWTEEFKILNHEYASYAAGNARQQAYDRQEANHAEGRKAQADYVNVEDLYDEWRRIVEEALNLGVDVEIIGMWIWVTGPNTYAARESLYALGFKWAHKKDNRTAYFNDMGVRSFSHGGYSMDDIRGMHGTQKVRGKNYRQDQDEDNNAVGIPATASA